MGATTSKLVYDDTTASKFIETCVKHRNVHAIRLNEMCESFEAFKNALQYIKGDFQEYESGKNEIEDKILTNSVFFSATKETKRRRTRPAAGTIGERMEKCKPCKVERAKHSDS